MYRREFIKTAAVGTVSMLAGGPVVAAPALESSQLAQKLPRWRGFNLLEKFRSDQQAPFVESDFQWISEWGFNFVRLPLHYHCWTDPTNPYKFDERVLGEIDQAVEFGRKYGVHVNLNLHCAPGYRVSFSPEKLSLWTDEEAQKQFEFQWVTFARRYRGVSSERLSFNLVNEPPNITAEVYGRVVRRAVAAIRREDAERLIIVDGLRWARQPVPELADLGIAQSTHGYDPMQISHYLDDRLGFKHWPEPAWPLKDGDRLFDRQWLMDECFRPWLELQSRGIGVHVGEFAASAKTPHGVVLAWMRDMLDLWKQAGWGWALWNLRGFWGVVDSTRADVAYEDFRGHKLDCKMLALLQSF